MATNLEERNARDVLRTVRKNNPRGSEKEIRDAMRDALTPTLREGIFRYWFENALASFTIEEGDNSTVVRTKARAAVIRSTKNRVKRIKAKLQEALLDHMLSDGKLLREATREDLMCEGGWLLEVAKLLKPGQTVDKNLTENDLRNLYKRNSR